MEALKAVMRRVIVAGIVAASTAAIVYLWYRPRLPAGAVERTVQGLRFIELALNGADASSPLIIAVHGREGSPERFAREWAGFPGKVVLVLPQGLERAGAGYAWYQWPPELEQAAPRIGAAEERLWAGVGALTSGRRVLISGFSQGAVLAYLAAARHPAELFAAVPVAGLLPPALYPHARAAPVLALHGTADPVMPLEWGRETVAAFAATGSRAELTELPGIDHRFSRKLRVELWARVLLALELGK